MMMKHWIWWQAKPSKTRILPDPPLAAPGTLPPDESYYFGCSVVASSSAMSCLKSSRSARRIEVGVLFHVGRVLVAGGNGLLEPIHRPVRLGGSVLRGTVGLVARTNDGGGDGPKQAASYKLPASVHLRSSHISAVARQPAASLIFAKCRRRRAIRPGIKLGCTTLPAAPAGTRRRSAAPPRRDRALTRLCCQTPHAHQRVGVLGAERDFPQRQRLFVEFEGVGVPAEGAVADCQAVHALQRFGVVGAELGFLSASVSSRSLRASACRPRSA